MTAGFSIPKTMPGPPDQPEQPTAEDFIRAGKILDDMPVPFDPNRMALPPAFSIEFSEEIIQAVVAHIEAHDSSDSIRDTALNILGTVMEHLIKATAVKTCGGG